MTIQERIDNYAKQFSYNGQTPLYIFNNRLYGDFIAGALYKRKNNYYGSYPHSVLERIYSLFPDCIDSVFHLFSGTIPYHFPDQLTMDIKPVVEFTDIGDHNVKHQVKPFICDDIRNILKYKSILQKRKIIIADPPYNDNHIKYKTEKVNKMQLLIDLEECCNAGTFLCWLDSSVPIYNAKTWYGYGRITVYVGANCDIRAWTILQRTGQTLNEPIHEIEQKVEIE